MKNTIVYIFMVISLTFIGSCKKEGPQGPPGNINIMVKTFSTSDNDWTLHGTLGTDAYYETVISFPEITQTIANSGTVLLYYQGSGDSWWLLPQIFYGTGYEFQYTYGFATGALIINRYDNDFNPVNPGSIMFKLIIIPGAAKKEWDVDLSNYLAVKTYFNLKD